MKKLSVALAAALFIAACGGSTASPSASAAALTGDISIDGSSTVYPIAEAVAEEFQNANSGVQVTVAFSGTGGGFKKFCAGEMDANNASRPIKTSDKPGDDGVAGTADDVLSEATLCKNAGIEYIELKVALDALAVVVSKENTFVDCLTTDELKSIWDLGSVVETWADVRAGWPAEKIDLYGPGADSGTFDYFTEVINGEAKRSRSDYTASEDDNTLVTGISGSQYAMGYFGLAYVTENADKVRAVEIDGGEGCTAPSAEGANDGTYVPLGRPLFVYASVAALARPEVAAFFRFFLENTNELSTEVGYIGLNDADLAAAKATLEAALK
ncbi:MAG: PstS family phosphate ABC transporter substrate-binding protein [Chloroflexi bacterium]|nr:PstS family phosphate ABC transporter substrate-binding protein [Chloroflexota bacterium]